MQPRSIRFSLLLTCFILFIGVGFSSAQSADTIGKVVYVQDSSITQLMERKEYINERKNGSVKGFRVQIHFGSDRDKAKEVKMLFIQKFNSVVAYEKYEQPNFKIRVGDFRTRTEAFKFLKEISPDFPSSFIVQDDIELKELLK